MGLSTLSGTSGITPVSPVPTSNKYADGTVNVQDQTRDVVELAKEFNRDSLLHRNAIDEYRFSETLNQIRRFIAGHPVKVTYYHLNVAGHGGDNNTDYSPGSIEQSYIRIQDFEIKLSESMSYSYMTDENVSEYTGEATMYPGMAPRVGDLIIYTTDDTSGSMGLFKITSFSPLSIRSACCWRITLSLQRFVNQTDIDNLEDQVAKVYYFNLEAYLGESRSFISSDIKTLLDDLNKIYRILTHHYVGTFFNVSCNTFIRPDELYDPYIVEFLSKFLDYSEIGRLPRKYILDSENEISCVWSALLDPEYVTTGNASRYYRTEKLTHEARAATITSMLNRDYIIVDNELTDDTEQYPLTAGIFSLEGGEDSFDALVRLYYEQRKIDPVALLEQAQNYRSLDSLDQFYRIPVYMFLATLARRAILDGNHSTVMESSLNYLPTEMEFDSDQVTEEILIVNMNNKAIGVIDDTNYQWMFEDGDVSYEGSTIIMRLSSILDDYATSWIFDDNAVTQICSWVAGTNVITVDNPITVAEGMAVEGITGIPDKTRIVSLDGDQATLNNPTDSELPSGDNVDVVIGWATIPNTWKAVFTGNITEE